MNHTSTTMHSSRGSAFPPFHPAAPRYIQWKQSMNKPSVIPGSSSHTYPTSQSSQTPHLHSSSSDIPPFHVRSEHHRPHLSVDAPVPHTPVIPKRTLAPDTPKQSPIYHTHNVAPTLPPAPIVATAIAGPSLPITFAGTHSGAFRASASTAPSSCKAKDRSARASQPYPHHADSLDVSASDDDLELYKHKVQSQFNSSQHAPQTKFALPPIELHPALLAPVFPDVVELVWDVSLRETAAQLRDRHGRTQPICERILSLPATRPRVEKMTLTLRVPLHEDIPDEWKRFDVHASHSSKEAFVTVGAVLRAVHWALREPLTREEVQRIARGGQRQQILQAFERRCRRAERTSDREQECVRGIKRVDCLRAVGFGGLERAHKGEGDMWLVTLREI